MGVGRIFSKGALRDFSKIFLGKGNSGKICFSHSKLRKKSFFANIFKIQGLPLPSFQTPILQ